MKSSIKIFGETEYRFPGERKKKEQKKRYYYLVIIFSFFFSFKKLSVEKKN